MSQTSTGLSFALNLPNAITVGRLFLAFVLFVVLSFPVPDRHLVGFILFIVAAGSDWLDGYLARRFGLTSAFGRMLDPFVDKILICGTLVFLVAEPSIHGRPELLQPWMAVIVLTRELLVTALRGWVEEKGQDFSAQLAGKVKMVVQSVACAAGLLYAWWASDGSIPPAWLTLSLAISAWLMVVVTLYSAWAYIIRASRVQT